MKNNKRLLAFAFIFSILIHPISAFASSSNTSPLLVTADADEYTHLEVFLLYKDGRCEVRKYEDTNILSSALTLLSQDSSVAIIQPNYGYHTTGTSINDPYFEKQWALDNGGTFSITDLSIPIHPNPLNHSTLISDPAEETEENRNQERNTPELLTPPIITTSATAGIDINAKEAWHTYNGGQREVIIALIDTGVEYYHQDLIGSMWVNSGEKADGIDNDKNGYIDDIYGWNFYDNNNRIYYNAEDDHGTHCAGSMIAKADNEKGITGIIQSDKVKIMSLKALGGYFSTGTTESIISSIQYAQANGASICNLSLGTYQHDPALYWAIANSDMLFVVAAGNERTNIDYTPSFPAAYDLDNIISVASISYDGTLDSESNFGSGSVDLAAPGMYILSTTTGNTYSYMSGTSMATPMVTATAAMLYSHYPDISLADVKEIILSTVTPIADLENVVASSGMLNIGQAMNYDLSELSKTEWKKPDAHTAPHANIAPSTPTFWNYLPIFWF